MIPSLLSQSISINGYPLISSVINSMFREIFVMSRVTMVLLIVINRVEPLCGTKNALASKVPRTEITLKTWRKVRLNALRDTIPSLGSKLMDSAFRLYRKVSSQSLGNDCLTGGKHMNQLNNDNTRLLKVEARRYLPFLVFQGAAMWPAVHHSRSLAPWLPNASGQTKQRNSLVRT